MFHWILNSDTTLADFGRLGILILGSYVLVGIWKLIDRASGPPPPTP